jgi:hypothetical protein
MGIEGDLIVVACRGSERERARGGGGEERKIIYIRITWYVDWYTDGHRYVVSLLSNVR